MAKSQKIITIETHRLIRIHSRPKTVVAWCEACGMDTLMVVPEQAAIICGTTARHIFRQIERGELHFIEMNEGALLICGNSLEPIK